MSIYLEHHGVKGQKWGVKHGPPYPLTGKNAERARKAFEKRVNRKIVGSYNKAVDTFNEEIKTINKKEKYKELTSLMGYWGGRDPLAVEYVHEVMDLWQKIFTDQALEDIGTDWVTNGKDWVKDADALYYPGIDLGRSRIRAFGKLQDSPGILDQLLGGYQVYDVKRF